MVDDHCLNTFNDIITSISLHNHHVNLSIYVDMTTWVGTQTHNIGYYIPLKSISIVVDLWIVVSIIFWFVAMSCDMLIISMLCPKKVWFCGLIFRQTHSSWPSNSDTWIYIYTCNHTSRSSVPTCGVEIALVDPAAIKRGNEPHQNRSCSISSSKLGFINGRPYSVPSFSINNIHF